MSYGSTSEKTKHGQLMLLILVYFLTFSGLILAKMYKKGGMNDRELPAACAVMNKYILFHVGVFNNPIKGFWVFSVYSLFLVVPCWFQCSLGYLLPVPQFFVVSSDVSCYVPSCFLPPPLIVPVMHWSFSYNAASIFGGFRISMQIGWIGYSTSSLCTRAGFWDNFGISRMQLTVWKNCC